MSDPTTDRAAWIIARLGDELGLSEDDVAALYQTSLAQLNDQLLNALDAPEMIVAQITAEIAARQASQPLVSISDAQLTTIKTWIARYPIRKLVPLEAVSGPAWRLTGDDAQWIAYRAADVIGLDQAASDVLRQRLNRVALSYESVQPSWDDTLRAQIAAMTVKLVALSGVL